jgi:hypothetical protein
MQGDAQVRFCGDCKLTVYNLSDMTTAEAEALVRSHEGRLCVRFYRRADGKVMTRDCPKGLAVARMKFARAVALTAGLVFGGFGVAMANAAPKPEETWIDRAIERGRTLPIVDKVLDKLCPTVQGDATVGKVMMGAVASPPSTKP